MWKLVRYLRLHLSLNKCYDNFYAQTFILLLCTSIHQSLLLEGEYGRRAMSKRDKKCISVLFYPHLAYAQKEKKLSSRTEIFIFCFFRFIAWIGHSSSSISSMVHTHPKSYMEDRDQGIDSVGMVNAMLQTLFLIDQFVKFFLLINPSNSSKHLT